MTTPPLMLADAFMASIRGDDGYETANVDWIGTIYSESPGYDYEETSRFHLARAQLDEMVDLLRRMTGIHDPVKLPEQAVAALRHLRPPTPPPGVASRDDHGGYDNDEYWEYATACVRDGLRLRRELNQIAGVGHSFAVDGSITLTLGPQYSGSRLLRLQGNSTGELTDTGSAVLEAAQVATAALAGIVVRSEPGDDDSDLPFV